MYGHFTGKIMIVLRFLLACPMPHADYLIASMNAIWQFEGFLSWVTSSYGPSY